MSSQEHLRQAQFNNAIDNIRTVPAQEEDGEANDRKGYSHRHRQSKLALVRVDIREAGLSLYEHLLNDAEEVDGIQEGADDQHYHVEVVLTGPGTHHQVPLTEEAGSGRQTNHGQRTEHQGNGGDGQLLIHTAEAVEMDDTEAVNDTADDKEQAALHDSVVDHVEDGTDEAVHIAHGNTHSDVADLCNRGVRQHTAEVTHGQSHEGTDEHTAHTKDTDDIQRGAHDRIVYLENVVNEANHGVGRSLTHAAGNEGSRTGMAEGVRIRLPPVEGEQRHLDTESDDEAAHRHSKQRRVDMRSDESCQVCHVEGTGHSVKVADAQQVEGSTDGTDKQIAEGSQHGLLAAQCNETIARQGHDLEKYIEVEHVAGGNHTAETYGEKTEERVVAAYMEPVLILYKGQAVEGDQQRNEGDKHQQNAVQRVENKLDADRGHPAAHCVVDGLAACCYYIVQHRDRTGQRTGD